MDVVLHREGPFCMHAERPKGGSRGSGLLDWDAQEVAISTYSGSTPTSNARVMPFMGGAVLVSAAKAANTVEVSISMNRVML